MNPKSIALLFTLLSIVLFMLGVNLGKRIEIVDKTHPFVTPATINPTTIPIPLTFKTFTSTSCGVSFLYPSVLEDSSSSTSAELSRDQDIIKATCDKKAIGDFDKSKSTAKKGDIVKIDNVNVTKYEINNNEVFEVINPINEKTILFEISPNLSNVVGKSIEFTK